MDQSVTALLPDHGYYFEQLRNFRFRGKEGSKSRARLSSEILMKKVEDGWGENGGAML